MTNPSFDAEAAGPNEGSPDERAASGQGIAERAPDRRAAGGRAPNEQAADERANVITHAVGLVAALVGTVILIVLAATRGDAWEIVGVSIFGASMIVLYASSTAYHAVSLPMVKAKLNVLDHAAIYLLIAGTYTPFMIDELRGGWGWSLFGVIWGLAIIGMVVKLFYTGRFQLTSTLIYVAMGWLVLIAIKPMVAQLSPLTLSLLVAGGVAYTAGTPFFHNERMKYAHAIWHVFVMVGTACHAVAVATII